MNYLDLLDKPFKWGGRGPDAYDCYGLCIELYRRIGLALPEYTSDPDFGVIDASMHDGRENWLEEIPQPEPYCLAMFRIAPPYVSHIGVVMADCRTFMHILRQSRVTRERLDSIIWHKKIAGFYRFKPCAH